MMVHVHFTKNGGNRKRMGHIGVTAMAILAFMGLFRIIIGAPDAIYLIFTKVAGKIVGERVDSCLLYTSPSPRD